MDAQSIGLGHFLAHSDAVGRGLFVALLLMSVTTWCLIVSKSIQSLVLKRRTARFLETFWDAPSLQRRDAPRASIIPTSRSRISRGTASSPRAITSVTARNKLDEAGTTRRTSSRARCAA